MYGGPNMLLFLLLVAGSSFLARYFIRSAVDTLRQDVDNYVNTLRQEIDMSSRNVENYVNTLRQEIDMSSRNVENYVNTLRQDVIKVVNTLKKDGEELERQIRLLEIQHENLALATSTKGEKPSYFMDQLHTLNKKIDELVQRQNKLEQQSPNKTEDNLKKLIDDTREKMRKLVNEMWDRTNKQYDEVNETLRKTNNSIHYKLMEFLANVKDIDNVAQKNHSMLLETLSNITSDLKTKFEDFEEHINAIKNAKDEADEVLSNLQESIELIRPNTLNKDNAVMAFLIVVMFVVLLAFWIYRVQQRVA